MIRASAAALAAVLTVAPVAASAAGATSVTDLDGVRGYVRSDQGAPLAGIALFVQAGLDRQTGAQNGLAALVAQSVLETTVDGVALGDAVEAGGGSIAFVVTAQNVRFYLEAPAAVLPRLAALTSRALAAPAFDEGTLAAARTALAARIAEESDDPRTVGLQMLRQTYYREGSGLPALGEPAALAQLAPADARAFYARWYVRGGAFLTAVGKTGPATDAAGRTLAGALAAGEAAPAVVQTRPFGAQPKQIVAQRDVSSPFVVVGFGAPAIGDRDFASALVIRALLGSVLQPGTPSASAPLRAAGVIYGYDASPAQFAVWINGSEEDPTTALATLIEVLRSAAAKPLAAATLARYTETARGEWALETLSLDERAFAIGNAVTHGLDADAADAVPAALAQVTSADVQRVAKRYFQRFDVALVVPRAAGSGN